MNNKIQLVVVAIISFTAGAFTVNYFTNNLQHEFVSKKSHVEKIINTDEKLLDKTESSQEKSNNSISDFKKPLDEVPAIENAEKKIDYIALSKQVDSFQNVIYSESSKKFKNINSTDIKKKENAEKKYILESSLNEMFLEKNFYFRATLKKESSNERTVIDFSLCDCQIYTKPPKGNLLDDACYAMSFSSLINNKWYRTSMRGSYSSAEWMEGQPYQMLFTEYAGGLLKASGTLRTFVPLPTKSGQIFSLKYSAEKLFWEHSGEIDWQVITDKEIKRFDKYVDNYEKNQSSREEQ